jgi:hypothetical protein
MTMIILDRSDDKSILTPSGDVGMVLFDQGIEMVWVSNLAESIDENWVFLIRLI